uniref:Uncharacterized protein n=1 Tax=Helianthus annuus TaxID=4232 RepID=A0A251SQW7_HELAN
MKTDFQHIRTLTDLSYGTYDEIENIPLAAAVALDHQKALEVLLLYKQELALYLNTELTDPQDLEAFLHEQDGGPTIEDLLVEIPTWVMQSLEVAFVQQSELKVEPQSYKHHIFLKDHHRLNTLGQCNKQFPSC